MATLRGLSSLAAIMAVAASRGRLVAFYNHFVLFMPTEQHSRSTVNQVSLNCRGCLMTATNKLLKSGRSHDDRHALHLQRGGSITVVTQGLSVVAL